MNENRFEMLAFALVSLLLTSRVVFMFASAKSNLALYPNSVQQGIFGLCLAIMILMCIFQVILGILWLQTWRGFGWKLYRTVGANKTLVGMWPHILVYCISLYLSMCPYYCMYLQRYIYVSIYLSMSLYCVCIKQK